MAKNKRLEIIKDIAVEMKAEDITVLDLRKFDTCGEYYISYEGVDYGNNKKTKNPANFRSPR